MNDEEMALLDMKEWKEGENWSQDIIFE